MRVLLNCHRGLHAGLSRGGLIGRRDLSLLLCCFRLDVSLALEVELEDFRVGETLATGTTVMLLLFVLIALLLNWLVFGLVIFTVDF